MKRFRTRRVFVLLLLLFAVVMPLIAQSQIEQGLFDELRRLTPPEAERYLGELHDEEALQYEFSLGYAWEQEGNHDFALAYYRNALDRARQIEENETIGGLLFRIGVVKNHQDRRERAVEEFEESAQAFERAGNVDAQANVLYTLANNHHGAGDFRESLRTLQRILDLEDAIEDKLLIARTYAEAAMVQYKSRSTVGIEEKLEAAQKLFEAENDFNGLGKVHRIYGNYYMDREEFESALESYRRSAEYYRRTDNLFDYANILYNVSLVHQRRDEFEAAIERAREAVVYFTQSGSSGGVGMVEVALGTSYYDLGRYAEAEAIAQMALVHLSSFGSDFRLAGAHELMGKLNLQSGDTAAAVDSYEQAVELYNATGNYSYAKPIEEWLESRE